MSARKGWHVLEMSTHIAIVPDYEDGHVLAPAGCWCEPKAEHAVADDGHTALIPIVCHRDVGERDGGQPITD